MKKPSKSSASNLAIPDGINLEMAEFYLRECYAAVKQKDGKRYHALVKMITVALGLDEK